MPYSRERELVEFTSSRKTGHQVERWGCHPTVKNSEPELFLSDGTAGTQMEKSLRKRRPSDRSNWIQLKGRLHVLTLLLMLWYTYKWVYHDCLPRGPTKS